MQKILMLSSSSETFSSSIPEVTGGPGPPVEMQDELKAIFGRAVDVIRKRGIERSRNAIRRKTNKTEVGQMNGRYFNIRARS